MNTSHVVANDQTVNELAITPEVMAAALQYVLRSYENSDLAKVDVEHHIDNGGVVLAAGFAAERAVRLGHDCDDVFAMLESYVVEARNFQLPGAGICIAIGSLRAIIAMMDTQEIDVSCDDGVGGVERSVEAIEDAFKHSDLVMAWCSLVRGRMCLRRAVEAPESIALGFAEMIASELHGVSPELAERLVADLNTLNARKGPRASQVRTQELPVLAERPTPRSSKAPARERPACARKAG